MIEYINQRYEPYGGLCGDAITRELTPGKAVTMLTRVDLGWGGAIQIIQPDHIRVRTSCMGFGTSRYDVTDYKGSAEEMEPLLAAVSCWAHAKGAAGENLARRTADAAIAAGINRPLHLGMLATLAQGGLVYPVLCATAKLTEEQAILLKKRAEKHADAEMERMKGLPSYERSSRRSLLEETIDPIIELVIDGQPFDECLAAA